MSRRLGRLAAFVALALVGCAAPASPEEPTPSPVRTSSFANDDYVSPHVGDGTPVYTPPSIDQAAEYRGGSPIYEQAMSGPIRCVAAPMDVDAATSDEVAAHLDAFLTCLMRAWDLPVRQAGFELTRPALELVNAGAQITTPCGTYEDFAGYYCSDNQQIYLWLGHVAATHSGERGTLLPGIEATLAHEYGHHVQARAGILTSSWWYQNVRLAGEDAALESRRRELQAQCLSGLALRQLRSELGVTDEDTNDLYDYEARSADADHGSSQAQSRWFERGYTSDHLATCNTWRVPESELE